MKTTTTFTFEVSIDGKDFKFAQAADTREQARILLIGQIEELLRLFKKEE